MIDVDLFNDLSERMRGRPSEMCIKVLASLIDSAYAFGDEADRQAVRAAVARLDDMVARPAVDWSKVQRIVLP